MATTQNGTAGTAAGPEVSARTTAAVEGFAENRGISFKTLERLRVGSATGLYFGSLKGERDAIVFRYFKQGAAEPIFWKARPDTGEKAFTAMKGGKTAFYNLDAVLAGDMRMVFITEGELDAAALVEAGVPVEYVLSVPAGASVPREGDEGPPRGYDFVKDALEAGLNRAKRYVFCGDGDGPGLALRHDLAEILGPARYHFVDWPKGVKDANDFLIAHGKASLKSYVVDNAKPWPVDGLYRLSDLPEPPPLELWTPGFPEWESKVRLARATTSVVTGQPGHGKTSLWAQIWQQVVRAYDIPIFVTTFETRAKPHMRRILRSLYSGKLEKHMSDAEIAKADRWIDEHYIWGIHPKDKPDIRWWLDMAETAIVRHGVQIAMLDPWNRLESQRNGKSETETEYIGRCLTEVYSFGQQMNAHMQILAHPAKMDGKNRGRAPDLEDISGSKHWENRVDQGFVVHRKKMFEGSERQTEATLFYRKSRFDELGHPCQLKLDYDLGTGAYRSTDYDVGGYPK